MTGGGIAPVVSAVPVSSPVVPAVPVPPVPSAIEPVVGPRASDAALSGGDKAALPAVPPIPSLPPAQLPDLPGSPKTPEVKPVAPAPGGTAPALPPLPMSTAEPPKAATPPPAPPSGSVSAPPMLSGLPLPTPSAPSGGAPTPPVPPLANVLPLPQPTPVTPSAPPAKSADSVPPAPPAKPNSDLKPSNPGNTLNPTVAPAVPILPGAGPETPARPVALPKPPEPSFSATDKDIFPGKPVTPDPRAPHQRDDTMLNLTTTAAFAFLGGAMLAVEKSNVPPAVPPSAVGPMTAVPLKVDDKDVEKLKTDLAAANRKIEDLEKQVKRLESLLTGRKDDMGFLVNPKEPGTVEDVKALKDKIAAMQREIDSLKPQTALRPAVVPEAKPRGVVKIVNEYPVEISMVVNDKSYRIAPGTKLDVEVPAGDFTYQLLQSGAAATKSVIKDKETVTLRIK
jgi:hypothetical protein